MASQNAPQIPEADVSVVDSALREYRRAPHLYPGPRTFEIAIQLTHDFLGVFNGEPMKYIASRIIDELERPTSPRRREPHPRWYRDERNMYETGTFQPGYNANFQGAEHELAQIGGPPQGYGAAPLPDVGQPPVAFAGSAVYGSGHAAAGYGGHAPPANVPAQPAHFDADDDLYIDEHGVLPAAAPGYIRSPPPVYTHAEQAPPDLRFAPLAGAGVNAPHVYQQPQAWAQAAQAGEAGPSNPLERHGGPKDPVVPWNPKCDRCRDDHPLISCASTANRRTCTRCRAAISKGQDVKCLVNGEPKVLPRDVAPEADEPCKACYRYNVKCFQAKHPRKARCLFCAKDKNGKCERLPPNTFERRYYNPGGNIYRDPPCGPCRKANRQCLLTQLRDSRCVRCTQAGIPCWGKQKNMKLKR